MSHKKYIHKRISSGTTTNNGMNIIKSRNLWASTDIRLTIWPSVKSFLAPFEILKAYNKQR